MGGIRHEHHVEEPWIKTRKAFQAALQSGDLLHNADGKKKDMLDWFEDAKKTAAELKHLIEKITEISERDGIPLEYRMGIKRCPLISALKRMDKQQLTALYAEMVEKVRKKRARSVGAADGSDHAQE